ncbi:MAG: sensor histidine kinase [Angelakisella sp.]
MNRINMGGEDMRKKGYGQLLRAYLLRNVKTILLLGIFAVILFALPVIYGIPAEAMVYALFLCVFIGLLFFLCGFYSYCKRHYALQEIAKNANLWAGQLPSPKDTLEQDYGEIVAALDSIRRSELSRAEHRERELREYFTTWVHQIKTPIAAMDLLLQQTDDHEEKAELATQLFRIEEYVGMVLQYLRSDQMGADMVIRRCSLDGILKQAVHRYAGEFIRKKLSLNYRPLGVEVLTDEKWLTFVVEQLLSNALKYTKSGGVSIYMEPTAVKTLVIEDTGIGVAPEDLPRVFENGFTGYNGRLGKKSTGIGLHLCRRILTGLSHTIRIEAAATGGTRVLVDLSTSDKSIE